MEQFKDYEKMIEKASYRYAKKSDCNESSDFFQEGFFLFLKAVERFEKERASFKTYFNTVLNNGFKNILRDEKIEKKHLFYTNIPPDLPYEDSDFTLILSVFLELSREAREVLEYTCRNGFSGPRINLKTIKGYFIQQGVFNINKMNILIKEIKIWWAENKNLLKNGICPLNFTEILINLE